MDKDTKERKENFIERMFYEAWCLNTQMNYIHKRIIEELEELTGVDCREKIYFEVYPEKGTLYVISKDTGLGLPYRSFFERVKLGRETIEEIIDSFEY